jgi:hypothetical protein
MTKFKNIKKYLSLMAGTTIAVGGITTGIVVSNVQAPQASALTDFRTITGSTFGLDIKLFEGGDTPLTRNAILNSMKIRYGTSLDVNQLYVDDLTIDDVVHSATIRAVSNSNVYYSGQDYLATGVAGNYSAVDLTYDNSTLTQTAGQTEATPTFLYHGAPIDSGTLTYSISPAVASPLSFTSGGVLTLTTGVAFAGAMYTITAHYEDSNNNTYDVHQQVYVQEFTPTTTGDLTMASSFTARGAGTCS